jgi:hypothetical protein
LEVIRRFYYRSLIPAWLALAEIAKVFGDKVGGFIEEAAARVALAWAVLRGKSPKPVEKRWWNRATETPALVDVYSWVDDRLIFSVLVWPSLESVADEADYVHRQRVEEDTGVIAKGAADKAWSTYWEVDYGLVWDHKRQVWAAGDGFAYEPPVLATGSLERRGVLPNEQM